MSIQLTDEQLSAKQQLMEFIINKPKLNPKDRVMVLSGHAGTGKTTLLNEVLSSAQEFISLNGVLGIEQTNLSVLLTGMTHKATSVLAATVKEDYKVRTLHHALSIPVKTKFNVNNYHEVYDKTIKRLLGYLFFNKYNIPLLVIDEVSYMSTEVLQNFIYPVLEHFSNLKIIMMGDVNQLPPVGEQSIPVFNEGFNTVYLSKTVRQLNATHLADCVAILRENINNPSSAKITCDDKEVIHLDKKLWDKQLLNNLKQGIHTKIIHYTNNQVVRAEQKIHKALTKDATIQVGDILTYEGSLDELACKLRLIEQKIDFYYKYRLTKGDEVIVTDVVNTSISVDGKPIEVYNLETVSPLKGQYTFTRLKNLTDITKVFIEGTSVNAYDFADLRYQYATTVHSSQGSTYDEVFINLNDYRNLYKTNPSMVIRLLYVAFSRARNKVYLTGDL